MWKKTACHTKYKSYKFIVMSFGLCNASLKYTVLINIIFLEEIDDFAIVYIDDILIFFKTTKEYASHLEVY